MGKSIEWGSPKYLQTNHTPRILRKLKPKQFCKKLQADHKMKVYGQESHYYIQADYSGRRGNIFRELRCEACGHKEIKMEKIFESVDR